MLTASADGVNSLVMGETLQARRSICPATAPGLSPEVFTITDPGFSPISLTLGARPKGRGRNAASTRKWEEIEAIAFGSPSKPVA